MARQTLHNMEPKITRCNQCPRLRNHCKLIAQEKRKAYQNEKYWGKPVPGVGVSSAELVIVGLAPAAHGANRTGRMFTGDRSGDWLYRGLYRAGFANQPTSINLNDGLKLKSAYITSVVKCAPPDNKPSTEERNRCTPFLVEELKLLKKARVYLMLGGFALNGAWPILSDGGKKPKFGHGAEKVLKNGKLVLMSYHPSQQNTFTGRLTEPMFDSIFERVNVFLSKPPSVVLPRQKDSSQHHDRP